MVDLRFGILLLNLALFLLQNWDNFKFNLNTNNFLFYYKQIIAMLVVMLVIGDRI